MQKIFLLLGTLLLLPVFSGELVDGKFKDWKKNSPLCVKESSGIAISGQMGKDIRWHFTPQKDFSAGGILMIKALVSKENIVSGKPGFRWAAPVLNVVDVSGEKRKVLFAHSFGLDSVKDQEFAKSLKIAPGTKRLEISLLTAPAGSLSGMFLRSLPPRRIRPEQMLRATRSWSMPHSAIGNVPVLFVRWRQIIPSRLTLPIQRKIFSGL